jgi:hypothetical protein
MDLVGWLRPDTENTSPPFECPASLSPAIGAPASHDYAPIEGQRDQATKKHLPDGIETLDGQTNGPLDPKLAASVAGDRDVAHELAETGQSDAARNVPRRSAGRAGATCLTPNPAPHSPGCQAQ